MAITSSIMIDWIELDLTSVPHVLARQVVDCFQDALTTQITARLADHGAPSARSLSRVELRDLEVTGSSEPKELATRIAGRVADVLWEVS